MAQKRKNRRKWVYWFVILLLLVAAGVIVYLVWNSYFKPKNADVHEDNVVEVAKDKNKEESDTSNSDIKQDSVSAGNDSNANEAEREKEKEQVAAYEGNNPNYNNQLTGALTYAGVNGGILMIRVNIDQYLDSGTCRLSLEGGTEYSDVANVVGGAATSTCEEGFDIPVSELASGTYKIIIDLNSGDRKGTIEGEVSV